MNLAGVRLYLGLLNKTIPNYAMIAGRDFGNRDGGLNDFGTLDKINDGLWCQSALNISDIGSWWLPNGNVVPKDFHPDFLPDNPNDPIHVANRPGQVGLLRSFGIKISPYQGMYTCTIPDETGDIQTLVVLASGVAAYDGTEGKREFKHISYISLYVVCGHVLV